MSSSADAPVNAVPLQNAVLCANCDVISDTRNGHCAVCGSPSLVNLARILGAHLDQKELSTEAA